MRPGWAPSAWARLLRGERRACAPETIRRAVCIHSDRKATGRRKLVEKSRRRPRGTGTKAGHFASGVARRSLRRAPPDGHPARHVTPAMGAAARGGGGGAPQQRRRSQVRSASAARLPLCPRASNPGRERPSGQAQWWVWLPARRPGGRSRTRLVLRPHCVRCRKGRARLVPLVRRHSALRTGCGARPRVRGGQTGRRPGPQLARVKPGPSAGWPGREGTCMHTIRARARGAHQLPRARIACGSAGDQLYRWQAQGAAAMNESQGPWQGMRTSSAPFGHARRVHNRIAGEPRQ